MDEKVIYLFIIKINLLSGLLFRVFLFVLQEKDLSPIMWLSTAEAAGLSVEELAARLQVNTRTGLWWQEADQRRQLVGYNELQAKDEEPTWKKYIEQVIIPHSKKKKKNLRYNYLRLLSVDCCKEKKTAITIMK